MKIEEFLFNELCLLTVPIGAVLGLAPGWVAVPDHCINLFKIFGSLVGAVIGAVLGWLVGILLPWAILIGIAGVIIYFVIPWLFR